MSGQTAGYGEGVENGLFSGSVTSQSQLSVVGGNLLSSSDYTASPLPPEINDNRVTLVLTSDGTDVVPKLQAAHDRLLALGGGVLSIAPRAPGAAKPSWKSTFFCDPRVKLVLPGKGLADFTLADNFPLASFRYRDINTGVVAVRPILQRCAIYVIPYAPFDPRGTVITPSYQGVIAYFEGFTIDGNKQNQSAEVLGIYAPPGKTDPNWAYVAGAYSVDQVAHPGGGTINMNADPQAYYGYTTRQVEIFNTSGDQFFAGADRQRTHLLDETKGTLGGVNNPDGTALYTARGFNLQGNDSWVSGGGFGNNNGIPQGSGQSGMMRVLMNLFSPKGSDAASLCTRDFAVNGSMNVGNVLNGLARLECSAGNTVKARGGGYVGNNFLWGGSMETSGPNTGRPVGVTNEEGDTFLQFQAYEQCVAIGNVFSVGTDGTTPKYHVSATQGAGVRYSGVATSAPDGSKSYRGTTPFFTDNTLGVVGYDYLDPYTQTMHIGVHWKGAVAGANIASTQFVQVDTPLVADLVGHPDANAVAQGFIGETGGATFNTTALTTNVIQELGAVTLTPGRYKVMAKALFVSTGGVTGSGVRLELYVSDVDGNTINQSDIAQYDGKAKPLSTSPTGIIDTLGTLWFAYRAATNKTLHCNVRALFSGTDLSAAGVLVFERIS